MPGWVLCLHHPEDLSELGALAGADDDADAVAVDYERPLEPHVVHVVHLQPSRLGRHLRSQLWVAIQ